MNYPVFVISLEKDKQRREALKSRFTSFDSFTLVNGVDGRDMSAKEYFGYANLAIKAHGKLLSPAEVGCALSHIRAYEAFLQSGAEFGLVLEDDVIGDDECINFAFEMAAKMPKNAILHCGCQDWFNGRFSAFAKKIFTPACNFVCKDKDRSLFAVPSYSNAAIWSAAAYVLTPQSANALLNAQKKALGVSDDWEYLVGQNGLKMYFCDIFSHPQIGVNTSNIEIERNKNPYKPSLKARFDSLKFIVRSRIDMYFKGYERIFKVQK